MVRLYLFAEGQTEQTFADNILKPHLAQHGVFMHNPVLIAHARKKGTVHRGGGRKYKPMKDDILRFLNQEKGSNVFFTTMIDLYAIAPEFPGLPEAEKLRQNPTQRVEFLEKSFAADIDELRFIPYIQLHEYEAYLFSDPTCFEFLYDNCSDKVASLKAIADYETPELINDGPDTAPSKRIIAQFPAYEKADAYHYLPTSKTAYMPDCCFDPSSDRDRISRKASSRRSPKYCPKLRLGTPSFLLSLPR